MTPWLTRKAKELRTLSQKFELSLVQEKPDYIPLKQAIFVAEEIYQESIKENND